MIRPRRLACLALLLALWPALVSAQYATKKIAAVDPTDDKGAVHVVVVFSGPGVKTVTRDYVPTDLQTFYRAVAADLADLNTKRLSTKDLQVGADVPDPTDPPPPPPPPPPTDDDKAVTAFQALVTAWRSALAEQVAGLADQAAVEAARAALVAPFTQASPALKARYDLVLTGALIWRF